MSDTVIKVENLYKEYRLGVVNHGTLRHDLGSWWARMRGKEDPNSLLTAASPLTRPDGHPLPSPGIRPGEGRGKGSGVRRYDDEELKQHFLALNDVSFEVKQGEALGIIGRNGAGKSTLLKILSRITSPTSGNVKVKGRIASLLEVGTGFHPELTGRENVYLNGAILGMRRYEIAQKMDEIVAFAGLEKFIDTPVKRYSSGMYVRLAFAVAAHLDAEILVLDEVLAVGDSEFQRKCLGKMDDVAKNQGRTVLFVSHNMAAINNLCSRAVLLAQGSKIIDDRTDLVVREYNNQLKQIRIDQYTSLNDQKKRRGSGTLRFTSIELLDKAGQERTSFTKHEPVKFRLGYKTFKKIKGLIVSVILKSSFTNECMFALNKVVTTEEIPAGQEGFIELTVESLPIKSEIYPIYYWLGDSQAPQQQIPDNYDVVDDVTHPLVIKAEQDDNNNAYAEIQNVTAVYK